MCSDFPDSRGRKQRTEWVNRARLKGVPEEHFLAAQQELETAGRVIMEVSGDGGLGRYRPLEG